MTSASEPNGETTSAAKIAELEEQVLRWRQAAIKTWATASASAHMDAVNAAETARARVEELEGKVAELQATNRRLRNQVNQLRRQQYARRAVRAAVRRLR